MSADHVPAWKRLGLKLKYVKEDASTANDLPQTNGTSHKRKQSPSANFIESSPLPAKKARMNGDMSKSIASTTPLVTTTNSGETLYKFPVTPQPKEPKRKKSVSFSADTKEDDSNTAQNVPVTILGSPGSTPRKTKKERKPKSDRKLSIASQPPKKSTDALEYLSYHFEDQEHWKFNKNREIYILKHALSTDAVPSTYNASLAGYVHGLKSVGAKSRLIRECQEALGKTGSREHHEKFQSHFIRDLKGNNLRQSLQEDDVYSSWLKNESRPILLLLSLGQPLTALSITKPDINPRVNGALPQRVKKSKARTSRIEIDSDSDSDSSSSDSDESSNSSEDGQADETSSSGSSDSDSTIVVSSSETDEEDTSSSGSSSESESDSGTEPKTNGKVHTSSSDSDESSDNDGN